VKQPSRIEMSSVAQNDLIERIKQNNAISDPDKQILTGLIEFNGWLQFSLLEKKMSINRLQNLFFGNTTEKSGRKKKKKKKTNTNDSSEDNNKDFDTVNEAEKNSQTPAPTTEVSNKTSNSGRLSHNVYINAEHVTLKPEHNAGDPCPEDCGGKLTILPPGMVVKITGQGFAKVTKYKVEKLRCNLCGLQINPNIPDNIAPDKYDAAFKAQLCMLKYYMGMPFYRIQGYQNAIGVPLPDSTQWDLMDEIANDVYPAFKFAEKLAASGHLCHADDTNVKILSNIKANSILTEQNAKTRKGTFTTGILSYVNEHKIYLFYSSKSHAGENMQRLFEQRPDNLPAVKYMCDALSRNVPQELEVVLINCLAHGRRKFVEIEDFFTPECEFVIDQLAIVYRNDATAKQNNLTEQQRLEYHQQHSKLVMDELFSWLNKQLDENLAEPNGSLGKAIKYMLNHWLPLTQFLRIPGAPLDNNILEQALKIPIRIRKNSMFFATEHGAYVGSMLLSLICTCIAAKQNPVEYLTALQINKTQVVKEPHLWMPWNYQNSMTEHQMAA
jgi:transposase